MDASNILSHVMTLDVTGFITFNVIVLSIYCCKICDELWFVLTNFLQIILNRPLAHLPIQYFLKLCTYNLLNLVTKVVKQSPKLYLPLINHLESGP